MKSKSLYWKRNKTICAAWMFSWCMYSNIIQIIIIFGDIFQIIISFGAVSSSRGGRRNIDKNEYFGKNIMLAHCKIGIHEKSKIHLFILGRFPQYLGKRVLLSCQFYFWSTGITLQSCFKNLWMLCVWSISILALGIFLLLWFFMFHSFIISYDFRV